MSQKRILVLAGPTGVGESTITNQIIEKYPIFTRMVTATSREPRLDEKEKIDYYFLSNQQFEEEIKNGNILEYTNVRDKNTYYGSYKPELKEKLDEGKNIIINLDLIGANFYKKNYNATTIFIMPDSFENLRKRHLDRSSDNEKDIQERLAYAQQEIEEESPHYDYRVINKQGKIEEALERIVEILKKEGYKLE